MVPKKMYKITHLGNNIHGLIEFCKQKYAFLFFGVFFFHSWSNGQVQVVLVLLFLDSQRVACHNYDCVASFLYISFLIVLNVVLVGKNVKLKKWKL